MKIYIKLTKEESSKWNSIKGAVMGNEGKMDDGDFAKVMLFRGLNGFMDDLNKAMDEMSEEEKAEILKEAGAVDDEVTLDIPVAEDEDNENSEISG